jgi:hypothetical protein
MVSAGERWRTTRSTPISINRIQFRYNNTELNHEYKVPVVRRIFRQEKGESCIRPLPHITDWLLLRRETDPRSERAPPVY